MSRTRLGCSLLLAALAGCGSKTAVRAPCEVQLERRPPAVVLGIGYSSGFVSNTRPDGSGRDNAGFVRELVVHISNTLDDAALLGGVTLPDLVGTDACTTRSGLGVPVGPHHAMAIQNYVQAMLGPNGAPTLRPVQPAIEQALATSASPDQARLLVLLDEGEGPCEGNSEYEHAISRLYADGFPTMVVGVFLHGDADSGVYCNCGGDGDHLNDRARAGGLVASVNHPFVDAADDAALDAALRRFVLAPYYCRLWAPPSFVHVEGFVHSDDGAITLSRDPSRTNGWDWTDPTTGRIEIFGPACDVAVTHAATFLYATHDFSC